MNVPEIKKIGPLEIEAESFRIIASELGPTDFSPEEFAVVRRCIHATGDFSFADNMRFSSQAVAEGLAAIRAGKNILVDVNMAAAGISRGILKKFGGKVVCKIGEQATIDQARETHKTRSEVAMELALAENIGIVAIGNAPTALLKVMALVEQGLFQPDLIIGVPVGFVNAVESKALLTAQSRPYITALGRKGGTPVAVAAVNALLRLA